MPKASERQTLYLGLIAIGLVVFALIAQAAHRPKRAIEKPPLVGDPKIAYQTPKAVEAPTCPAPMGGSATHTVGDPRARAAAQRGLDFLTREAKSWQAAHQCYGCHVHAVTLEALVVGTHHQYNVPRADLRSILDGMLTLRGGARGPTGLSYEGNSLHAPSKAFGGAAFAHYDAHVGSEVRNDLIQVADQLLAFQLEDGSIRLDWTNPPVGAGATQGTYQAVQTWRQAYARTADDRWLSPIRKSEAWLQAQARAQASSPAANIQDVDYTLLGLQAAGSSQSEASVRALEQQLLARQGKGGGFGFTTADASNAFATGQAVYTLRALGRSDGDPAVARGTRWLLEHQAQDGGWSHAGFGKAEAMWGVLGLVSVDVLSVALGGVEDGQRVEGKITLAGRALDNSGVGVRQVAIAVDDVRVQAACGGEASFTVDADALPPGKHLVDVIALNGAGKESRRRVEIYTGPTFLTEIGTRSTEQGTELSLRNIGGPAQKGRVEVQFLAAETKDGATVAGRLLKREEQAGAQGPARVFWDGKDAAGVAQPRGRYVARVIYRDGNGRAVQTEELGIVRDSDEAQRENYGRVEGSLRAADGAPLANTVIDLVDKNGKVVQSVTSTAQGQYRFKDLDEGGYSLRIAKKGFAPMNAPAPVSKAKAKAIDLQLN